MIDDVDLRLFSPLLSELLDGLLVKLLSFDGGILLLFFTIVLDYILDLLSDQYGISKACYPELSILLRLGNKKKLLVGHLDLKWELKSFGVVVLPITFNLARLDVAKLKHMGQF